MSKCFQLFSKLDIESHSEVDSKEEDLGMTLSLIQTCARVRAVFQGRDPSNVTKTLLLPFLKKFNLAEQIR